MSTMRVKGICDLSWNASVMTLVSMLYRGGGWRAVLRGSLSGAEDTGTVGMRGSGWLRSHWEILDGQGCRNRMTKGRRAADTDFFPISLSSYRDII
jgi:hypothetical protein